MYDSGYGDEEVYDPRRSELLFRVLFALSFLAIPPGSAVTYRIIVYVVMYMLAGKVLAKQ